MMMITTLIKKTISNLLGTSHNFLALRILCSCEAVFQAALGLIALNGFTIAAETAGGRFLGSQCLVLKMYATISSNNWRKQKYKWPNLSTGRSY